MKRSAPPKRKTPLRADPSKVKAWLNKKRKRIRPTGKRNARMKEQGLIDEELRQAARESPCYVTGRPPPSIVHHVRRQGETRWDVTPEGLCRIHPFNEQAHDDWHGLSGDEWREIYGFPRPTKSELAALARKFGRRFQRAREQGEET